MLLLYILLTLDIALSIIFKQYLFNLIRGLINNYYY